MSRSCHFEVVLINRSWALIDWGMMLGRGFVPNVLTISIGLSAFQLNSSSENRRTPLFQACPLPMHETEGLSESEKNIHAFYKSYLR